MPGRTCVYTGMGEDEHEREISTDYKVLSE